MKFSWIGWASRRFLAGRKGSRGTFTFSVTGIAFGVMTLNVVLAVMNGFQQGFIRNILEVGSYHLRWTPEGEVSASEDPAVLLSEVFSQDPQVAAVVPFREGQTLLRGHFSNPSGALVRAVPHDLLRRDSALADRLSITAGIFDVSGNSLVLGDALARDLGVDPGDSVSSLDFGGPGEVILRVSGLFHCGYLDYDRTLAFVSFQTADSLFGDSAASIGIKLVNPNRDRSALARLALSAEGLGGELVSWRDMNRSFFGALRTEKLMMLFLVGLIFVVVAVNIKHALRRVAAERTEDIALMKAVGASPKSVRMLFLRQGLALGGIGGGLGTALGVLIALNIDGILASVEFVVNALLGVFPRGSQGFFVYPPDAFYVSTIPSQVMLQDVVVVLSLAVGLASLAAWRASSLTIHLRPAILLRNE